MKTASATHSLADRVIGLLDQWALPPETQRGLLGLTLAEYAQFCAGEEIHSSELAARIGHILAIQLALHRLFPHQNERLQAWMRRRNPAFGQRSPVDVVWECGLEGLLMVRNYLHWKATTEPPCGPVR